MNLITYRYVCCSTWYRNYSYMAYIRVAFKFFVISLFFNILRNFSFYVPQHAMCCKMFIYILYLYLGTKFSNCMTKYINVHKSLLVGGQIFYSPFHSIEVQRLYWFLCKERVWVSMVILFHL